MNMPRSPRARTVLRAFTVPAKGSASVLGWCLRKAGLCLHRVGSTLEMWGMK